MVMLMETSCSEDNSTVCATGCSRCRVQQQMGDAHRQPRAQQYMPDIVVCLHQTLYLAMEAALPVTNVCHL